MESCAVRYAPPLDSSGASAKFLAERFPDSAPKSQITLPDTAAELIEQYDAVCEQLETITKQKPEAENLLKQMLEENKVFLRNGLTAKP